MSGVFHLDDLDIPTLATAFPTRLLAGRTALVERLSNPVTDADLLQARKDEITRVRAALGGSAAARLQELHQRLATAEPLVIIAKSTANRNEFFAQLLWDRTSFLARLNESSIWTEASLFFRTILLPGLGVVMPLMMLAAPLIVLYLKEEPVDIGHYLSLVRAGMQQNGKLRFAGKGPLIENAEQITHIAGALVMMIGSAWSQVSSAIALREAAGQMRQQAAAIRDMVAVCVELSELLGVGVGVGDNKWTALQQLPAHDLAAFGSVWNKKGVVASLLRRAGHLDMLLGIASCRNVCVPSVSVAAVASVTNIYHPSVPPKSRIYNSLHMKNSHVLLTGPNRGGKSTLLKALGIAVLMHQTVGIVFAEKATLPLFQHIVCALSPVDRVGELSLFEAEIEFAKSVRELIHSSSGPTFILMDEIFHGTNAHDGVEAAQVFLDELFWTTNAISVISTHYPELPERYGDGGRGKADCYCMEATLDPTDPEQERLCYTYRLIPGMNHFSSVREILRERGLLRRERDPLRLCEERGLPAKKTSVESSEINDK